MRRSRRPGRRAVADLTLASVLLALAGLACAGPREDAVTAERVTRLLMPDLEDHAWLPETAEAGASEAFWERWGDGRAELAGYRIRTSHYGEVREGELVLITVTEPHDRRTWIKDDDARPPHRVEVLKQNVNLRFLTGIYPYHVMTSVFAPVEDWGRERFSPVKLTFTAQEWCGHYFAAVWPGRESLARLRLSYFARDGETIGRAAAGPGTLYEDALPMQLRELDGPFAGGGDWEGELVPTLWRARRTHGPMAPVPASIRRSTEPADGPGERPVHRFRLVYGDLARTFRVEGAPPRRILGWTTEREGRGVVEEVELLESVRLPYWRLNAVGGESYRKALGLATGGYGPPAPGSHAPPAPGSGGPPSGTPGLGVDETGPGC